MEGALFQKQKQKNVHGLGFGKKSLTKRTPTEGPPQKARKKKKKKKERKERSDGGRNVVRGILRVRGIESNLGPEDRAVRERTKIGRFAITCKQTGEIIPLVNFSNLREELAEILGPHLVDWEDEGKRAAVSKL